MHGLNKLGIVLTVVVLVSLLALVTEILYVLWRRLRRRSGPCYTSPSKEQLVYLFCWKNQSRVEPAGKPQVPASEDLEGAAAAAVVVDDDVAKWQLGLYGPSRALFTIKEEEREGTETDTENDLVVEKSSTKTVRIIKAESKSSLCDEEVVVRIETVDEATPFSTPCASPPYYTPSPSPTHDKFLPGKGQGLMMESKGENDVSFVRLEVRSE